MPKTKRFDETRMIRYLGPGHRLVVGDETVERGETLEVTRAVAEELVTAPYVDVEIVGEGKYADVEIVGEANAQPDGPGDEQVKEAD